jgi:hypothetical protein
MQPEAWDLQGHRVTIGPAALRLSVGFCRVNYRIDFAHCFIVCYDASCLDIGQTALYAFENRKLPVDVAGHRFSRKKGSTASCVTGESVEFGLDFRIDPNGHGGAGSHINFAYLFVHKIAQGLPVAVFQ